MRIESINKLKKISRPVLITGHTGFKGTWLTLLLESQGIEVVGISLEPDMSSLYSKLNREGKIYEKFLDICDFEILKSTNSKISTIWSSRSIRATRSFLKISLLVIVLFLFCKCTY